MIRVEAIRSPPLDNPAMIFRRPRGYYSGRGWSVSTSWLEGYKVSLTNVTRATWTRPVIEYIVYVMDSSGQIQHVLGSEQLNEIPINGEITFITNQFMMQHTTRTDGHNTLPGKLLGVRVRIYDHRNGLIQDYAAPWALMVWQKWEYPLNTEGHGLVTPLLRGVPLNG